MDYSQMTLQELSATRRALAQTVNRQIRRLREKGYTTGNALQKYAEPYLRGRRGFSESKSPLKVNTEGKTQARIEYEQRVKEIAEINAMLRFKNAQTYKISGIKKQRKKAQQAFAEQLGVKLSDQEIAKLYEYDAFSYIKQVQGSDVVNAIARAINAGASTPDEVRQKINAMRLKYSSEDLEDKSIEEIFEELGMEFKPEYLKPQRREE